MQYRTVTEFGISDDETWCSVTTELLIFLQQVKFISTSSHIALFLTGQQIKIYIVYSLIHMNAIVTSWLPPGTAQLTTEEQKVSWNKSSISP